MQMAKGGFWRLAISDNDAWTAVSSAFFHWFIDWKFSVVSVPALTDWVPIPSNRVATPWGCFGPWGWRSLALTPSQVSRLETVFVYLIIYYCHKEINLKFTRESLWAVDHSARGSMKSAAKRVSYCELQDYLSSKSLNANCGFGYSRSHVRLRVELYN